MYCGPGNVVRVLLLLFVRWSVGRSAPPRSLSRTFASMFSTCALTEPRAVGSSSCIVEGVTGRLDLAEFERDELPCVFTLSVEPRERECALRKGPVQGRSSGDLISGAPSGMWISCPHSVGGRTVPGRSGIGSTVVVVVVVAVDVAATPPRPKAKEMWGWNELSAATVAIQLSHKTRTRMADTDEQDSL